MSVRLGIMGFGSIGRHLYRFAQKSDNIIIPVISDIGNPEILHYLLSAEDKNGDEVFYKDNYLKNKKFQSRMFQRLAPGDVPWDVFDVDVVIDATGKFNNSTMMHRHLNSGAKRVIISSLPEDIIDRLVICGVNQNEASPCDKTISAGSSTMNALSLVLNALNNFEIEAANMTSIHSYTSDQPLQDVAGSDFRRSRSAAENIIPNISRTESWITHVFPQLENKIICNALNVPVQKGSMLDLSISFSNRDVSVEDVNNTMIQASENYLELIGVSHDPIVSSDIIGDSRSVVFDLRGTMKAGTNMVKMLAWYDNGLCHAARIFDVIKTYANLNGGQ